MSPRSNTAPGAGFRQLTVWQRAMDLVIAAHRIADRLPAVQRFGLADQIRRAAVSITANIAEGSGLTHLGDYLRQLSIARGSACELESHFEAVRRLGYATEGELHDAVELLDHVSRLLKNLMRSLRGC